MLLEGETGSITHEGFIEKTSIEVVATEGSAKDQKGILMNLVVSYNSKDGKKTVVAKPQVLVRENELAKITIGGEKELTLTILAKRKTL